jgi:hypothetical protein
VWCLVWARSAELLRGCCANWLESVSSGRAPWDDIRTCGLACEDFAQLPARARPASTSRRRRKPPNYRLRLLLHCGVTWQTSQTARRLLSPSTRSHLSPGYRSQPVAQVPELDNVIAQPVELGDDADR